MFRPVFLTLPLVLGFACASDEPAEEEDNDGGEAAGPNLPADGIWLLRAEYNDDDSCTELMDHNFEDSYTQDEGPWTETDVLDYSDSLGFVQISQLDQENAVMVSGTQVWPGTSSGDGWVFAWDANDVEGHTKEHEEGYTFQETTTRTDSSSLSLTITGDLAQGTWTFASEADVLWRESDTWDSEVGLGVGDIPSAEYLVYDEGEAEGLPRYNLGVEGECSGAQCELRTNTVCSGSATISLTRTGYDEEAAYDQLEGVGHPFGTGS